MLWKNWKNTKGGNSRGTVHNLQITSPGADVENRKKYTWTEKSL